jgi:hypothetical protein
MDGVLFSTDSKQQVYHFLYVSFEETPNGRNYVGAHSTDDLNDGYLGSFSDTTFNPTDKIIIGFFNSRKSLLLAEGKLQKALNVVESQEFANKSYQTSDRFCTAGVPLTDDHKEKIRKSNIETFKNNIEERKRRSERVKGDNNPSRRFPETDEQKASRVTKVKQAWSDPSLRERHSDLQKQLQNKPEVKIKRSNSIKKALDNDAERSRRKLESAGRRWYSNKEGERKFAKELPGDGWKLGYYWTD